MFAPPENDNAHLHAGFAAKTTTGDYLYMRAWSVFRQPSKSHDAVLVLWCSVTHLNSTLMIQGVGYITRFSQSKMSFLP
jgi:hypothetical protein